MSLTPTWKQPSHPGLIEVVGSDQPFGSYAISLVSLPAGAHFTHITDYTLVDERSYATVQASATQSVLVHSDLLYLNHSCDPTLELDMSRFEVRVSRSKALRKGDRLTFFYPSTEFQMAQPFDCRCDAAQCKGRIAGANLMASDDLRQYWLNDHVELQLREKESAGG
ncbi:hypothetical protein MMC07_001617 [Pseudocyphellaria aurata]|nr:hypothetical protein [Pseudocyphellaria aurata]